MVDTLLIIGMFVGFFSIYMNNIIGFLIIIIVGDLGGVCFFSFLLKAI